MSHAKTTRDPDGDEPASRSDKPGGAGRASDDDCLDPRHDRDRRSEVEQRYGERGEGGEGERDDRGCAGTDSNRQCPMTRLPVALDVHEAREHMQPCNRWDEREG